jgi:serine/threonine protein kinase
VAKKGEGTFSEVLKAQAIKSGHYVAIKCMKNNFDSLDQVCVCVCVFWGVQGCWAVAECVASSCTQPPATCATAAGSASD